MICSRSVRPLLIRVFVVFAFSLGALFAARPAIAQTGVCWADAKTGKLVPKENLVPSGTTQDPTDPDRASQSFTVTPVSRSGGPPPTPQTATNNFVRGADGTWSNAATGQPVPENNLVPNGTTQDPSDPDRASQSFTVTPVSPSGGPPPTPQTATNNYVRVPCPPQTATTTPPTKVARGPGTTGMGFTPSFQLRGFGGATIVNGNAPSTAGFDGAVLFPLGNRVLVGPTAGFQWVNSSIVSSVGSMTVGSTFANTSVGFKSGNFGGRLGLTLGGWELGANGGATVAGSSITQNEGFCDPTAGCTVSSTTTHDTVVGPFVGGYISHSIFSHAGVFVEFDYHRLKDNSVFDVSDRAVVGGIVLSFGRHK